MFFDTHAHLNSELYLKKHILDKVISDSYEAGVHLIIVNGYDIESSKKAIEIASKYPWIYATVGIHPGDIKTFNDESINQLRQLAKNEKVVAIGEIGLDYHYEGYDKAKQIECFKLQLALAKELDLPVTIHSRDAINDTYEILKVSDNYGVMHCYSSSVEYSRKFIELGFYISLAGPVTFKNARVAILVAQEVPMEKLLIETDCPYLTPHPYRGKMNEPKYIKYVAEEIAILRGITVDEVCQVTTANGKKLFGIK